MSFSGRGKGFRGGYNHVPPPHASVGRGNFSGRSSAPSHVYKSNQPMTVVPSTRELPRKMTKSYFEDDDEDESDDIPQYNQSSMGKDSIDFDDPLDAFMANVEDQVKREEKTIGTSDPLPEIVSGMDELEDYDDYIRQDSGVDANDDDVEYDIDGVPLNGAEKTKVEPLPPVDHSAIHYKHFRKVFYSEHREISSLSEDEVQSICDKLETQITGSAPFRPIQKFHQAGFPQDLLKAIAKVGYEAPTAIQAQALPIALSGRDLIGLAKTGSGKTLSFVWPMIIHILDQPQMQHGDGPIGLILAPTRELATQIFTEAKLFAKVYNIRVCPIYGGAGKWEMIKALKEAPEMVVATPGRFIELARSKATNLERCTMIVLDEADRMFEMGFEYQMRSIVNNIRPDRQTLLFSATMKKKVEGFAREILKDPVRIVVGSIGQANPDIAQVVELMPDDKAKWAWLASRADEFVADGKVLIFVGSKSTTEELALQLRHHFLRRQLEVGVDCLHGDKDQSDRSAIMRKFSKTQETSILVATDIASRGLDVKDIRTVINYEVPKNIETYVHRIGRTGRMGLDGIVPGTAYSLLTNQNGSFAVDLVQNLNLSGQPVPAGLQRLAEADPKWGQIKHFRGKGTGGGGGGGGGFGGGGGGGGRGVGIGFGGASAPKAMTSAMLSAATAPRGAKESIAFAPSASSAAAALGFSGSAAAAAAAAPASSVGSLIGDVAGNRYIEGQALGRGKHLTQPSWAQGAEAASTKPVESSVTATAVSSSAGGMVGSPSEQQFADAPVAAPASATAEPGKKRTSRFSAPVSAVNQSVSASVGQSISVSQPTAPIPAGPVMKGFVRASSSFSSVSAPSEIVAPVSLPPPPPLPSHQPTAASSSSSSSAEGTTKRSRWDS